MKNKKIIFSASFLLILSFFIYQTFIKPHQTRTKETYLKSISKKAFILKTKKATPLWMRYQISKDLNGLSKGNITLKAIDKTYEKIIKTIPNLKQKFIRYRIINNKIYRYYPKNIEITKYEPCFEKALKTLTKLTILPDIDFIYSDMDGTPESYVPKDFYILKNIKNQAPLFNRARLLDTPYVALIPDYHSVNPNWKHDCQDILNNTQKCPWETKEPIAFWRGAASDKQYTLENYLNKPRIVLSTLSKKFSNLIDAGITKTCNIQLEDTLEKNALIKEKANYETHLHYKYLPVMDGYMCTCPGYQWRLLSNSVCFKQESNEIQWFYSALKPYEHFIPIKNDMSDLVDKIKWAKEYDPLCKQISKNATKFAMNNLMIEDVYLYTLEVLKNYKNYLAIDKNELLDKTKKDPNWICVQTRKIANKKRLKRKNAKNTQNAF